VKVLGPEELGKRANYSRPHTVHCGPGYLYVSCLGGGNGADGPGGVALLDLAGDGGPSFDGRFFLEGEAFRGRRAHQVRLEGGDASSDSYCYSS
jgi:hypothetical protein